VPRTAKYKPQIVFVTGTDTGVGKTVLTALLLSHLRQTGSRALAIKPFCSGGRADEELLHALQDGDLTLDEVNPFHFPEPLAPLVAARKCNQQISLKAALAQIPPQFKVQGSKFKVQNSTSHSPLNPLPYTLFIEGAGGLLAPLGEPNSRFKVQGSKFKVRSSKYYTALDLIHAFNSQVILVAPNRLGVINHTLLTIQALQARNIGKITVVLMDLDHPSLSHITHHASRSNPSILAELLYPTPLFRVPNLGKNPSKPEEINKFAKKFKKTLAEILA
jgi:dethiobiotin synthetase